MTITIRKYDPKNTLDSAFAATSRAFLATDLVDPNIHVLTATENGKVVGMTQALLPKGSDTARNVYFSTAPGRFDVLLALSEQACVDALAAGFKYALVDLPADDALQCSGVPNVVSETHKTLNITWIGYGIDTEKGGSGREQVTLELTAHLANLRKAMAIK